MPATEAHPRSRLRAVAARYREARRSLDTPGSQASRRGLDWMNFFLADVQTGFGTFVAFYLADLHWAKEPSGLRSQLVGLRELSARYRAERWLTQ